jgi:hypothetical protein
MDFSSLKYNFSKCVSRHLQKCDLARSIVVVHLYADIVQFIHHKLAFLPTHGNGTIIVLEKLS